MRIDELLARARRQAIAAFHTVIVWSDVNACILAPPLSDRTNAGGATWSASACRDVSQRAPLALDLVRSTE
jgi:hypothetical protein